MSRVRKSQQGPALSSDTRKLLDELIGDSRLNAAQQRTLKKELNETGVLPDTLIKPVGRGRGRGRGRGHGARRGRRSEGWGDDEAPPESIADRNRKEWLAKRGKRTKQKIAETSAPDSLPKPHSTFVRSREAEKLRLQRKFAGVDSDDEQDQMSAVPAAAMSRNRGKVSVSDDAGASVVVSRNEADNDEIVEALRDEFHHLQADIRERETFLREMEELGKGAEYRPVVMSQIRDKLAAMTRVDNLLRDREAL